MKRITQWVVTGCAGPIVLLFQGCPSAVGHSQERPFLEDLLLELIAAFLL